MALSIRGRLSAGEGWSWVSTQASFLALNPHFSAGLEKQKSAQQKAARQPEGTQLLEGVGTVPAEVAVTPSPGRKGL